jgi:hypothetical protein
MNAANAANAAKAAKAEEAAKKERKDIYVNKMKDARFFDAFTQWRIDVPPVYTIDDLKYFLANAESNETQQDYINDFIQSILISKLTTVERLLAWAAIHTIGTKSIKIAIEAYHTFYDVMLSNAARASAETRDLMGPPLLELTKHIQEDVIGRINKTDYGDIHILSILDLFNDIKPYANVEELRDAFQLKMESSIGATMFDDVYSIGELIDHFANTQLDAIANKIVRNVIIGTLEELYTQCELLSKRKLVKLVTPSTPDQNVTLEIGKELNIVNDVSHMSHSKQRDSNSIALLIGDGNEVILNNGDAKEPKTRQITTEGELFIIRSLANSKYLESKAHIKLIHERENPYVVLCQSSHNYYRRAKGFLLIRTEVPSPPELISCNRVWVRKIESTGFARLCHLDVICIGACANPKADACANPKADKKADKMMYRFFEENPGEMRLNKVNTPCNVQDVHYLVDLVDKSFTQSKFQEITKISSIEEYHIFKNPKIPKRPDPAGPPRQQAWA